MTHPLIESLQVNDAQFVALRRRFHQQPEIGFEEHKTSDEVAGLLLSGDMKCIAASPVPAWSGR